MKLIQVLLILYMDIITKNRSFIQTSCTSILFILLYNSGFAQLNNQKVSPNIIVFLVDDMGWQDTSVPFGDSITRWNKRYRTPNMERLAREGMKFTNAYSTPVCTPSRISMMTGMNAARHRVTNWTSPQKNTPTDAKDDLLNRVDWNINGLSPVQDIDKTVYATPLALLLKQNGYTTIHVGKAHFAPNGTPGADPLALGFDYNTGGGAMGHPASYFGAKKFGYVDGGTNLNAVPGLEKYYNTDTFLTEALTIEAKNRMKIAIEDKKPFFLHMSHYAVHVPFDEDRRFVQKYTDQGLEPGEAKYAALIEGMDKSLGDIMDFLSEQKIDGQTLILFISDNGGFSLAPPRQGEPFTQNTPLRSGKGSVYEGGIRVPMLVKWPGTTNPASGSLQNVIIEDFFPTILEIAGIGKDGIVQKLDGESFVKSLKGSKKLNNKRKLLWHYPNKWIPDETEGISWHSAMRRGDWKIVYDQKKGSTELYNLKYDISEKINLVKIEKKWSKKMSAWLTKDLKDKQAQLPVYKSTGESVSFPNNLN